LIAAISGRFNSVRGLSNWLFSPRFGRDAFTASRFCARLADGSDLIVPEGTVYPLLARLKSDGYVDSEWVEAEAGHPRKYYSLTRSGRRRVTQMAHFWSEFSAKLDHLIAPIEKEDR
jgi:DNA-binding PadR family transcriptional regulator